jgi:aryl-alcohol dehydrogenase-like predicted oxidoreductase
MAEDLNLSVLDWSPLGAGVLTGKYLKADASQDNRLNKAEFFPQYTVDRAMQIAQVVVDVAAEAECSAPQVALAWIRQQSPRHIPIIGARTLEQLKDNLSCLNVVLNNEQLIRLNAASAIDLGFPLKFLRRMENLVLGAAPESIDLSLHPTSRIVLDRK